MFVAAFDLPQATMERNKLKIMMESDSPYPGYFYFINYKFLSWNSGLHLNTYVWNRLTQK